MSDLISREEAIDEIKALYEWHDTVTEDRAVDHLKRLPTIEPDGDTISIQMAIEHWGRSSGNLTNDQIAELQREIESLPSAEQVTGKLNNPDESLLTADSEACKEQKSKLDLISRQDAIRKCCGEKCGCEREDCGYTECCSEVSRLERLPSAPDSRQRGEWVRKYDGHINCYWYECDQCGEYRPRNQFGHEYNANFCPNCGADMKGQNDGQKR